ncbi:MAG: FG-GAP-like repeat-containing protein [Balneolaceae bacterium]
MNKKIQLTFICLLSLLFGCSHEKIELTWVDENGYRWADLPELRNSDPGFEQLTSSVTGITIENELLGEQVDENRVLMNGSGVAAGDVDGDGLVDLYFAQLYGENRLYKNLGGYQFEDITDKAGVAHEGYLSTGTLFADVNGNGHLDLLVTSIEKENTLYINDGNGNFERKENSGLGPSDGSMSMALADINGSGYPDLYIVNYKKKSVRDIYPFKDLARENMVFRDSLIAPYNEEFALIKRDDQASDPRELGEKDELYINNGDGTFSRVEDEKKTFKKSDGSPGGLHRDWGLTARFQDLNGNGLPDLYVANDFWTPDRIWMNQGDGTFQALDTLAIRNSSFSSMAVDFSDINRNGFTDIFVVEMLSMQHQMRLIQMDSKYPYPLRVGEYTNRPQYNRNSLFVNRGDNTYAETSYFSGNQASEWSWTTRFMDITLDGYEDILVNTGFKLDLQDLDAQLNYVSRAISNESSSELSLMVHPELRQKNIGFKNNGNLTFSNVSSDWGFTGEDISLGMAVADLNNNGLLDLAVSRMDDEGVVYRNTVSAPRIAVRLKGTSPNTQAIGTKLELRGGPVESQTKQVFTTGEYLSGSDPMTVFAADPEYANHTLFITWPDGTTSRLDSLRANRKYEINQSDFPIINSEDAEQLSQQNDGSDTTEDSPTTFSDISDQISHSHHEELYDDYTIQPLLPYKLSQFGPGLAWLDVTSDGRDELIIGTGRGGEASVFRFDDGENATPLDFVELTDRVSGDQAGMAGWTANGRTHVVVGMANYEQGTARVPSAVHYQIENGSMVAIDYLPGALSTTGSVAAADYNADGQMDLFIGGRFLPGQYPENASSRLMQLEDGNWVPDQVNNEVFSDIGLVTDALFIDLNKNGAQDLILATEWGPVRVFENENGRFVDQTEKWGLHEFNGLWQGLSTGDFTGNGYPDLVVTNRGENSPYQLNDSKYPLKLFYRDFNQNQQLDIIDTYYDEATGGYVPRRKYLDFSPLHENMLLNIGSHREFARSTIEDLTRMDPDDIPSKSVNTLQHTVFVNNGGKEFTATPLPDESQLSAGFYAGVADMDNDGNEDIFMSQNFFPVYNPESNPRLDAGRGMWLRGDGSGNFEPVPGHISGIEVYGDQRGAALGDFDRDGRVDLAVSQNAAETRLFRNETEKKGIRVTLTDGPQSNTAGVGSSVRLQYGDDRHGPVRYIQAGSGYWSQNSLTQVLGYNESPSAIEVTWFDGTVQTVEINSGQTNYQVSYPD